MVNNLSLGLLFPFNRPCPWGKTTCPTMTHMDTDTELVSPAHWTPVFISDPLLQICGTDLFIR